MAAGDFIAVFTPLNNEPPATDPATFDVRNDHPVLDFDAAVDESAVFTSIMPQHYDGSGLTVKLHYAMSSAIADDVVFDVAIEKIGDESQDIDLDGFAAVQSVTDTVPATSGHVGIATVTFTDGAQMDNVVIGDAYRIKVTRDADNAADDAAGDMELVAIEIRET